MLQSLSFRTQASKHIHTVYLSAGITSAFELPIFNISQCCTKTSEIRMWIRFYKYIEISLWLKCTRFNEWDILVSSGCFFRQT